MLGSSQLDLARRKYERMAKLPHGINIVAGGFKSNPNQASAAILGLFEPLAVFEALDAQSYEKFRRFVSYIWVRGAPTPCEYGNHRNIDEMLPYARIKFRPWRYIEYAEEDSDGSYLIDSWISREPELNWIILLLKTKFIVSRIENLLKVTSDPIQIYRALEYVLTRKRNLANYFLPYIEKMKPYGTRINTVGIWLRNHA